MPFPFWELYFSSASGTSAPAKTQYGAEIVHWPCRRTQGCVCVSVHVCVCTQKQMCAVQNKWGYSECHKTDNLWPVSAISQAKGVRWVGIKTLTVLFTLKKQRGVQADEQRYWERVIKEKQSLMFVLWQFILISSCSPYMVLRNRAAAFFWGGQCGGGCMGSSAAGIHHSLPARPLHLAVN